jgi:hypothetical protein
MTLSMRVICWWYFLLLVDVEAIYTSKSWSNLKRLIHTSFPAGGATADSSSNEDSPYSYADLRMLEFGSQHFLKSFGDIDYAPFSSEGYISRGNTAKVM